MTGQWSGEIKSWVALRRDERHYCTGPIIMLIFKSFKVFSERFSHGFLVNRSLVWSSVELLVTGKGQRMGLGNKCIFNGQKAWDQEEDRVKH